MKYLPSVLGCILASTLFFNNASATHLVGGNLRYAFEGQQGQKFIYEVTFQTFQDCTSPFWGGAFPRDEYDIGVYENDASQPGTNKNLFREKSLPLIDSVRINPNVPDTCTVGSNVCIYEVTYRDTVQLPFHLGGYYFYFAECCRNNDVINLSNPGGQGMAFLAFVPDAFIENSSPTFSDLSTPYICTQDTTSILNTAFDPDGDELIFSFQHPYDGVNGNPDPLFWPLTPAQYAGGFGLTQPFGTGGYAFINPATGLTQYYIPSPGQYVVTVEIKEFRDGDLIGVTRRDLQLLAITCPVNPDPVLSSAGGSGQVSYVIEEGENLCFPLTFYDTEGDSLFLEANGDIFDSNLVNPPATLNNVQGDSLITTQFCWDTDCGQGQGLPYLFTVSVRDNGCPPKTTNVVYSITVNPFTPADSVMGPDTVCAGGSGENYSVQGTAGSTFSWTIIGGTQISGGTTNNITVLWSDTTTSGRIEVIETSQFLCGTVDTAVLDVFISSTVKPDAGSDVFLCGSSNGLLNGVPQAGYSYVWRPGTNLNDSTSITPLVINSNPSFPLCDTTEYVLIATEIATGCTSTDTARVVICPDPVTDAGQDLFICEDSLFQLSGSETAGLPAVTYSWGPPADAIQALTIYTVSNPTGMINFPAVPDTFVYTLEIDNQGCKHQDAVAVIGTPIPVIATTSDPDTLCAGESALLTVSGANSHWWALSSAPQTPISTDDSIQVSPDTTTIYLATGEDTLGCESRKDSLTITVHPLPAVSISASEDTICFGDNTGLTASGALTYWWAINTAPNDTVHTGSSYSVTPDTSTVYIVTGTDANGCSNRDSIWITVHPLPVVVASSNLDTICHMDSVTLSGSGAMEYWWATTTLPNDTLSKALSFNDAPNATTAYIVTGTDINGCINDDTVTVVVDPLPVFTTDVDPDSICQQETAVISVTGPDSYWWAISSTPADTFSTQMTDTVSPDSTTAYILYAETAENCALTDTLTLWVDPKPDTSPMLGSHYVCPGVLGVSYWLNDPTPGQTYTWSVTLGTITGGQGTDSITVDWGATIGQGEVWVVETNAQGCTSDTMSMDVRINPELTPEITVGPASMCADQQTGRVYATTHTNGSVYTWGIIGGTIISGHGSHTVTVNWDTLGVDAGRIWFDEFSATNDTVCQGTTDTMLISIHPIPVVNTILGDLQICAFDTGTYYVNGDTGHIYSWTVTGGTIVSGDSTATISVAWGDAGVYNISVIPESGFGCVGSAFNTTVSVTPLPVISAIFGDSIVCRPNHLATRFYVQGLDSSQFNWQITGGTITSGQGSDTITVDWNDQTGAGTLTVTETTKDSCTGGAIAMNLQIDAPAIAIDYVSDMTDDDKDVTLQWILDQGDNFNDDYHIYRRIHQNSASWAWITTLQQTTYLDENLLTHQNAYQYRVAITDLCEDTVWTQPHNTILLEGSGDEDNKQVSLNWNRYNHWELGVGSYEVWRKLDDAGEFTFYNDAGLDTTVNYDNAKDGFQHCYKIKATQKSGTFASWSNELCLDFTHLLEIPSAFSPNGDGVNDTWGIKNVDLYPNTVVEVYNRWGNRVFGPYEGYVNQWDGARNGKDLPDGTYFYIVDLKLGDGTGIFNGSVTIIR